MILASIKLKAIVYQQIAAAIKWTKAVARFE